MTKDQMQKMLLSTPIDTMFPIFIPSYLRAGKSATLNKLIIPNFSTEALKRIYVVVRPEQYKEYKKAYPQINILTLTGEIKGLASTRQWICDFAAANRMPYIIDMDDDITQLRFLYSGVSGSGNACSKLSTKDDGLEMNILAVASGVCRGLFKNYPDALYGNIRRRRMSMGEENALVKYQIQSGPTPRQVTFINIKGLKRMGVERDMIFEPHGDDIGFAAVVLSASGQCFNLPSFAYDYVDEKCDSVVRTPANSKRLHKYEYDMLMTYPIKDYLRTSFRDIEGNYMWGDIDWSKFHKLQGTKRIKIKWEGCL